MSALDVLSIQDAKQYLRVDFDDDNDLIEDLIRTAVSYIENYTCYRLYKRTEVIKTALSKLDVFQYPINETISVTDKDGDNIEYEEEFYPLRTLIYFSACRSPKTITLDVGFESPGEINPSLRDALKKLVSHYYENRLVTRSEVPNDIQDLLNPFRRFTYF